MEIKEHSHIVEEIQLVTKESITIKNQANVIKDLWSELQEIKRILMDDYKTVWSEIQKKRKSDGF